MSVNADIGSIDDTTVGGGKVWSPTKKPSGFQGSDLVLISGPIMVHFILLIVFLGDLSNNTGISEPPAVMTEGVWGSNLDEPFPIFGLYLMSAAFWTMTFVMAVVIKRSRKFWKILFSVTIPFSIIVIAIITFLSSSSSFSETPSAHQWAQENYGYTLLEEPTQYSETILVETSEGIQKTVNVVKLDGAIYLTENHEEIHKMLEGEKRK